MATDTTHLADMSLTTLEDRLARAFLTATMPGSLWRLTEDHRESAAVAMRVIGPVLEAQATLIGELRRRLREAGL